MIHRCAAGRRRYDLQAHLRLVTLSPTGMDGRDEFKFPMAGNFGGGTEIKS
jgi:hypothetical protein